VIRAAVIGGGPAGCAAAWALARRGRRVVLYEREAALGGRATSWRRDGAVVDSGAGFFTNFYPTLERLVDETGLRAEVIPITRTTSLTHAGRVAPFTVGSLASFAAFPLVGVSAKLRMAAATAAVAAMHRRLDMSRPETLVDVDDRSVEDDARARVGEEAYQFFVRPGIEPFWYFSCADVSRALSLALQARAATARFYTLRGGMDSVCHALARNAEVRLATSIERIGRAADGLAVGDERYDEVVVATPAPAAALMTRDLDTAIASELRRFLDDQRYVANVHAAFVVPRRQVPAGMSALFPCGPGAHDVAAVSFNSTKAQGALAADREIVSVFIGDAESRRCLGRDDASLYRHAWSLARALLPSLPMNAEPFALVRRRDAIPLHAVGRYRLAAEARARQRGPIVFAGDYLATATVDGALASGLDAAAVLTGPR
jgi:protoporphyrinogen/coproporphyrinogen III oxidase